MQVRSVVGLSCYTLPFVKVTSQHLEMGEIVSKSRSVVTGYAGHFGQVGLLQLLP